jgi:uncharacterized protein YecE (DUF72 family)
MTLTRYQLGCPIWANKEWTGELYTRKAGPKDFLREYATVFNTVEGNTTFYGLPSTSTVERWKNDTPVDFKFFLKFPKVISHEKCMMNVEEETLTFLRLFAPLEERLGPHFLQLPAAFGPRDLPLLSRFLDSLSLEFSYCVEVRHPEFFLGGRAEQELNRLLEERGVDRVILDARPLHRARPDSKAVVAAQRKKPHLPVRPLATAEHPVLRYISHPKLEQNEASMKEWARVAAEWIREGKKPYIFIHTPDNHKAPQQCVVFHKMLSAELQGLEELAPWPGELEDPPQVQLSLFG